MRKAKFFNTAIVAVMLLFGAAACGSAKNDVAAQGQTGAVSFKVKWVTPANNPKAPSASQTQSSYAASIDCAALGVSSVMEAVTDSSANVLAVGGPFACTAGQGDITGVPVGTGYSVVFQGISSGGMVVYQGTQPNISVTASQTTNAGTIVAAPVTTTVATLGTSSVGTSAASIIAATNTVGIGTGTGTGTGSGTGASTAPSAPTGVTVTAGNAQATVSWTAVTGATSYNVYYRTSAGVTIANGTKVTGATSGSAVTGLTNGTAYYFIVTAVNAAGESAASTQASATPVASGVWPTSLSNGLISYWKFDGNSNDSVGTNNGTDISVTYAIGDGKLGQGARFNGTSSFINITNNFPDWTMSTVSFWAKSANTSGGFVLFDGDSTSGNDFDIALTRTVVEIRGDKSGHSLVTTVFALPYDISSTWVHIVWTMDSSGSKVYANGVLIGSTATVGSNVGYHFNPQIGRLGDGLRSSNFFNGSLDELCVWSRALTSTEVTTLYNGGVGMQYP